MFTKTASFIFRLLSAFMLLILLFTTQGATSSVSAVTNIWTNNGPIGVSINVFAIDPSTPTILYTGTEGGGVASLDNNSVPFTNCAIQTQIPLAECDALVALYTNTNGASWTNNTGWLLTDTPCSWYGIVCDNGSNVTALDLSYNNLIGAIPPELGNLSNLQVLYLGVPRAISINPEVRSTPIELADLQNQLSGVIPPELGNLTSLRLLALSDNKLSGAIPHQLGNLTNLQMLALDGNQLGGPIPPELGSLTKLKELYLRFNQLVGVIPPELGNLANLGILALSNNRLSGSIPPELGNLTSLNYLVLNNNRLNGAIPPELGSQAGLELLILSDNQLSGSIPPELGNLTNLGWLYLHSNRLSGEFPTSITYLTNLTTFTFDCWIISTNPTVIAFIEALVPGWQNSTCPVVLSITRGNPNPTSAASVIFSVTFSESVMGVGVTDFNLATSNITGASITNVSGSGTTYIVTVHTGTPNDLSIGLININSATLTELDSLPGIGPTIAQRIIDYRTLNGPFYVIEDIMNVSGIGPATFYNIKDLITVGGSFIRLDMPLSAFIIDLVGNPLGQLPFNTGETYTVNKNVEVHIGGALQGSYLLPVGESTVTKYALDGGPVEIRSNNGADIVASLYQLRRRPGTTVWTGAAQSMTLPVEEITDKYVIPRYDYSSPTTLFDQVLIANVDTVTRDITVTIGGTVMGTYTLAPSESQYLRYSGVVGGPVVVSSVVGAKIVASLYALIRDPSKTGWIGQSEMMGLPGTQLSDKYLIPMYFGASSPSTLKPYLYIANVDTMATTVEVKIAGVSRGTYPLNPNTSQVVNYVLDGGPVEISSNNGAKIVASLFQWRRRPGTTPWTGITQSMALPVELITDKYVMPRYDYTSPTTLFDQVLIANVDTVTRDITVKIGANVMGTYTLAPSGSQYLRYNGVVGGPVVVSSVAGAKIVASLYELIRDPSLTGWIGQSEMMGLPGSQLSDKYLIPMYFGASSPNTLQPSLYIGVP